MADDAQLGVVAVVVAVPPRLVAALKMAADPKLRAAVVAVPLRVVAAQ